MKMRIAILGLLLLAAAMQGGPPQPPAAQPTPATTTVDVDSHQDERLLSLLREQDRLLQQQRLFLRTETPQPPPSQPAWLFPLLLASVVSSVLALALLSLLWWRSRKAIDSLATRSAVSDVAAKLDAGFAQLVKKVEQGTVDGLSRADDARIAIIDRFTTDLDQLQESLGQLTRTVDETAASRSPATGDTVHLEHQILAEHWKQFLERKELSKALDGASPQNPWESLLTELMPAVPAELRPSFEAVLLPYREHRTLLQKIGIIPRVVSGEMPLSSEAAELKRARELTQLLVSVQNGEGTDRFQFHHQSWITNTFLPFADLYLQSYQKARLERRDAELQKGMTLVRQLLRVGSVEPIDVTLGETRFDSARHIGRFTSSDPQFPDGVITGVVRNGFVEGGQQVIRQPEVIVNRVR